MSGQAKVMFEIYRDAGSDDAYRVVYYTELSPRNRDFVINQALAGEPVFHGYLYSTEREEAGREVDAILEELNSGAMIDNASIHERLRRFLTS